MFSLQIPVDWKNPVQIVQGDRIGFMPSGNIAFSPFADAGSDVYFREFSHPRVPQPGETFMISTSAVIYKFSVSAVVAWHPAACKSYYFS